MEREDLEQNGSVIPLTWRLVPTAAHRRLVAVLTQVVAQELLRRGDAALQGGQSDDPACARVPTHAVTSSSLEVGDDSGSPPGSSRSCVHPAIDHTADDS